MPMFTMRCLHGHSRDIYAHNVLERACRSVICEQCHSDMSPVFSPGTPLTYFGEGGAGKWIHNLGHEPVFVTSHKHHQDLMRKAGVEWAPPRRGMPGQWS